MSMMGKKGEMAPFLDSGCQKYGRPWDTCGSKLISPEKEMARVIGLAVIGLVKINI